MSSRSERSRSPLFITRIASFTAIGIVAGLALASIPNVELVTAVCFTSGYLLGPIAGMICGGLTEGLFAGFHPMGSSIGLTLIAQMIGMSVAGLLGGIAAKTANSARPMLFAASITAFGTLSTIFFDFITNLAYPIMAGFSFSGFAVSFAAALPFAAIHIVSNAVVFAVIVAPLLPRLERALDLT